MDETDSERLTTETNLNIVCIKTEPATAESEQVVKQEVVDIAGTANANEMKLELDSGEQQHVNIEPQCVFIKESAKAGPSSKTITLKRREYVKSYVRRINECALCNEHFPSAKFLVQHLKIHIGSSPFMCMLCNTKSDTAHKLKVHLFQHCGLKIYPCRICGKVCTTKCNLKTHMELHVTVKGFKCPKCKQAFYSMKSLLFLLSC